MRNAVLNLIGIVRIAMLVGLNQLACESISRFHSLHGPTNQIVLPNARQGEDRRHVGPSRNPYRQNNRGADPAGEAFQRPNANDLRCKQAVPNRVEMPWPHLACGSNGGAHLRRLLDPLDPQRHLAAIARVLVGAECDRSFLTTVDGVRRVQMPADV